MWTRTSARTCCRNTSRFCPSDTTSTGRRPCALTWKAAAIAASISHFSAPAPASGESVSSPTAVASRAGRGSRRGGARRGLLGNAVAAIDGDSPAGRVRLAHSPFVDHGRTRFADMTLYTAESGAIVFASGSMQWNWGLDGYNAPDWHSL